MSVPKIILFYVFTPLPDPEAIRLWQHELCQRHHITGRIIISTHGINATVGGDIADMKKYVRATRSYVPFRDADIKWSNGLGNDFPRLSVKVRQELVTFGRPEEISVTANGVIGGGIHLKPDEVHALVEQRGNEVVFFDGRNAMEAEIGRFRDAVIPNTRTTRDFIAELESGKFDDLKDRPVITYCTGGIRCEILSVLMKNRGFREVYQLDGGIVRYGEAYGNKGLWQGSLYVFDKRMHMEFSDDALPLGRCASCGEPTGTYVNCADITCRELFLRCDDCETSAPMCPAYLHQHA